MVKSLPQPGVGQEDPARFRSSGPLERQGLFRPEVQQGRHPPNMAMPAPALGSGSSGAVAERVPDRPGSGRTARFRLWSSLRSVRSEEHTSELQSLMRISYAVFCLKKKKEA